MVKKITRRVRRPRSFLVPLILLINTAVFIAWQLAPRLGTEQFMIDNFLVSWTALAEGRFWVLLTAVFSHNWGLHFLINMLVLISFARPVQYVIGRRRFYRFYLIAGIVSSMAHAYVSAFMIGVPELPALGASGALAGILILFSLLFPREKILIFGIIPMPAILGALLFVGLDLWGLIAQTQGGGLPIGHGAHLGGAFVGLVYYLVLRSEYKT